ncbi:hypothetical protein ACNI0D_24115 [Escherichia coli]
MADDAPEKRVNMSSPEYYTAGEILAAAFVIFYSGVLLFILYFCFSALTDLQKPDERKSDERNEDE